MAEETKILDFSSLDKLDIPDIQVDKEDFKTLETSTDYVESNTGILEVDSISDLDNVEDDDPQLDDDDLSEPKTIVKKDDTNDNPVDEEPIAQIAKWGHELGILDFNEEEYSKFEDKEEYFKEKFFEKAKKLGTESLPSVIKELAEKYIDGVPLDQLIGSISNQQRLDNIDEDKLGDDTQLQESLVAQYLSLQDYDDDEIKTKLEKFKDALMLEDEAKTALKKLKKYEKTYQDQLEEQTKKQKELEKENYKKQLSTIEDTIRKTETFIPGITMDKNVKQRIFDAITKVDRDGNTELSKKMSSMEMQLAVAQFVLQLDAKLDSVSRKATTQAVQKLKEKVNTQTDKNVDKNRLDMMVVKEALNKNKNKNRF